MKNALIIFVITLVIAGTLIVIYARNIDDITNVDVTGKVETQYSEEKLTSLVKAEKEINSDTPIELKNKTEEDEPLPKDVFKCLPLTEIQKQVNNDILNKFARDNVLFPYSVQQYLTKLDKDELIAEFEAGNASAAYVLGSNLLYSSYTTNFHNPALIDATNFSDVEITADLFGKPLSKIDIDKLTEARKWLWLAAINGISNGLSELSATYSIEHNFLEAEQKNNQSNLINTEKKLKTLKVKKIFYTLLHVEVAPQAYDLLGIEVDSFKKQLELIQLEGKEQFYKDIETQWVDDRYNIGQSKEVEFEVPEEIKIAAYKNRNQCFN